MTEKTHPYKKYESTETWATVDSAIQDLIDNRDIELTTAREYVVGYIVQQISEDS